MMVLQNIARAVGCALLGSLWLPLAAHGTERVTLQSGFDLLCDHRVADGVTTRLFLDGGSANYIDVETAAIASDEVLPPSAKPGASSAPSSKQTGEVLSPSELHEVLQGAGAAHDLDVDLLASVVHAESGSRVHARSRAGAQGLMQLMPGTAAELGVRDAFSPKDNVGGGTAYLDALLTRYHGNVAWALAAYNAGPGAVDRWHGVPPYRETRAYVARIIHEFNGRYAARLAIKATGQPRSDLAIRNQSASRNGSGQRAGDIQTKNFQENVNGEHKPTASAQKTRLPLAAAQKLPAARAASELQTAAARAVALPNSSFEGEQPR